MQGPLVAVDEMSCYATLVRNQGHQVSDPISIDDKNDLEQALATWALQCMHAREADSAHSLFLAPVLYMSHWSPVALHATSAETVMTLPHDLATRFSGLIVEACGSNEIAFQTFMLPS